MANISSETAQEYLAAGLSCLPAARTLLDKGYGQTLDPMLGVDVSHLYEKLMGIVPIV